MSLKNISFFITVSAILIQSHCKLIAEELEPRPAKSTLSALFESSNDSAHKIRDTQRKLGESVPGTTPNPLPRVIMGYIQSTKVVGCSIYEKEESCQECFPGYYLKKSEKSDKKCYRCPSGCFLCSSSDFCTKCNFGKFLTSSSKCLACPSNCYNCVRNKQTSNKVECQECSQLFTLTKDMKCLQCPLHCQECSISAKEPQKVICSKCIKSYKRTNNGKCLEPSEQMRGEAFLWGMIIVISTGAFITVICPNLFSYIHKNAQRNKISSLKMFKKLKKGTDEEDEENSYF